MSTKKLLIGLVIIVVAGAGIAANLWWREPDAPAVQAEPVERLDLVASVSGSGAIRPAREVDVSSNVMGRITRLEVVEGQVVERGELLLEIDPQRLRSQVDQMQANLESSRTQVQLAQEDLEFVRDVLDRREGLFRQDLIPREAYEQALREVQNAERTLEMRQADVRRLEAQVEQARYDLSQVIIEAPNGGIITRLNVEEGENVVTGTMNNPGTVIMTIADLSVIESEIEVDETDVVHVEVGQDATVRIDAFPDRTFAATVSEVGKSPISAQGSAAAGNQAINFKVVVRLTETVPGARPGLSCTADIVTARRAEVLAVPIQALVLREVKIDAAGNVVRDWQQTGVPNGPSSATDDDDTPAPGGRPDPAAAGGGADPAAGADEHRTVEREGAFVVRDGRAVFMPVEIGIAGERHFEVLSGLDAGDDVITGPFELLRTLADGDPVRRSETAPAAASKPGARVKVKVGSSG